MLAWMVYAVLVALAWSAAALMAEQAAKHRRRPLRWPWIMAMAASILLPIAMVTVSLPRPTFLSPPTSGRAAESAALGLRDATSIPLVSRAIDWSGAASYTSSVRVNAMLADIWIASSVTLLLFLGAGAGLFHWRKRRWVPDMLCGEAVLVSAGGGPAVAGLIRSRIVVPAWVMEESPEQQRYIVAHERSHLRARDPLLVAMAMTLVVAMPWNPLLWWQFHRLRCAIEVDCDARVLADGGDVADYCETLIQVGQNQSEFTGAVTAMSESRSFLERRMRIMLSAPRKWARGVSFALISVALGLAVFAAQVTPPATPEPSVGHRVTIDAAALDAYTGFYALSDYSLATIERKDSGLTVTPIGQFLAQGTIDLTAIDERTFAVPGVDVALAFVRGADGRIASMTVSEHGVPVMEAPRIDGTAAEHIREDVAFRVKEQKPFPDSEKALRLILSNADRREGVSPAMADILARQRASTADYLARLGPVQSYKFEGVTDYGWDIYDVQHEHGAQQVFIQLDKHGLLTNVVTRRQ